APSAPAASVAVSPALQPASLVPAASNRDAFFAMLGSASSASSVNQITQRPAERNAATILTRSPEAAPTLAERTALLFAGAQPASDDWLAADSFAASRFGEDE